VWLYVLQIQRWSWLDCCIAAYTEHSHAIVWQHSSGTSSIHVQISYLPELLLLLFVVWYPRNGGRVAEKLKKSSGKPPPLCPLIQGICNNSGGTFIGFGCYLANDFLFNVAIHPATPAIDLCTNDNWFIDLPNRIESYLEWFIHKKFYTKILAGHNVNQHNSFEFHRSVSFLMCSYISTYCFCLTRQIL